jgi:hypothetical protein
MRNAEGLANVLGREQVADQAEGLRHHDRAEQALQHAGADQRPGRPGRRAQHGSGDETGGTGQDDPLAAEHVAEPAAGQQADRERQRVGGGDPLQARVRTAQIRPDRRGRDVDYRRVENVHDRRCEDGEETEPATVPGTCHVLHAVQPGRSLGTPRS